MLIITSDHLNVAFSVARQSELSTLETWVQVQPRQLSMETFNYAGNERNEKACYICVYEAINK